MKKTVKWLKKSAVKKAKSFKKLYAQRTAAFLLTVVSIIILSGVGTYALISSRTSNSADSKHSSQQSTSSKQASTNPATSDSKAPSSDSTTQNSKSDSNSQSAPNTKGTTNNNGGASNSTAPGGNTQTPSSPSVEPYPVYSFNVTKNGFSKAYAASTITYTFNMLITPTYSKFGNPTIVALLVTGTKNYACQNRGASVSQQYNGNNSLGIQCIVTRVYPSQPGQPPAPLQSQTNVEISVYGVTSTGDYTNGALVEYLLDYGYDR